MNFYSFDCVAVPASVNISRFNGQNGVDEYHLMIQPTRYESIDAQLECIFKAYRKALDSIGLDMQTSVLRRFFCSDLVNQSTALKAQPFANPQNNDMSCAVSWVGQSPAAPAKTAMWAYHISDKNNQLDKVKNDASLQLRRGELSHYWTAGVTCPGDDTSYGQTQAILEQYDIFLKTHGMSLNDNVIRTWFFVQDIDANYQGLVTARREFFAQRNLTQNTHFIASTGVEGMYADVSAKVTMDAYAVSGVRPEQLKFLSAPQQISPTHIYGVTFERGVAVDYRDRRHVIISGTASI